MAAPVDGSSSSSGERGRTHAQTGCGRIAERKALEKRYKDALKAYKANKENPNLKKAKNAAKRAWEDAAVD